MGRPFPSRVRAARGLRGNLGGTAPGMVESGRAQAQNPPTRRLPLVGVKGMSAMFCPQCGVPLFDRIQFCRAFGAGISDAGSVLSTTESGFLSLASAPAPPETRAGGQPSAFGGESALPAPRAARKLAARVNRVVARLVSAGR